MFQRLDIMAPAVTKLKRPVTAYLREIHSLHIFRLLFPSDFPRSAFGAWRRMRRMT
jgi:hypothetical protein